MLLRRTDGGFFFGYARFFSVVRFVERRLLPYSETLSLFPPFIIMQGPGRTENSTRIEKWGRGKLHVASRDFPLMVFFFDGNQEIHWPSGYKSMPRKKFRSLVPTDEENKGNNIPPYFSSLYAPVALAVGGGPNEIELCSAYDVYTRPTDTSFLSSALSQGETATGKEKEEGGGGGGIFLPLFFFLSLSLFLSPSLPPSPLVE